MDVFWSGMGDAEARPSLPTRSLSGSFQGISGAAWLGLSLPPLGLHLFINHINENNSRAGAASASASAGGAPRRQFRGTLERQPGWDGLKTLLSFCQVSGHTGSAPELLQ